MARQAEWKLLSAEKKLNKRGFINAQVLATLFTLINPEPRYSFWLAYTSFDHLIIFQLKTCNKIFDYAGTVLEWWNFLCILRAGPVLGKNQVIGVVHICELSNLLFSCNNLSWNFFPIHVLTWRSFHRYRRSGWCCWRYGWLQCESLYLSIGLFSTQSAGICVFFFLPHKYFFVGSDHHLPTDQPPN